MLKISTIKLETKDDRTIAHVHLEDGRVATVYRTDDGWHGDTDMENRLVPLVEVYMKSV